MGRGRMSVWLLCAAMAALACMSTVQGAAGASSRVEADMLVTRRITIERDRTVSGWTLDRRDRLPREVVELIDESLPSWRFEPVLVDGQPVRGTAAMRLSLHARPMSDGGHGALIADARFGLAAKPARAAHPEERAARIEQDTGSLVAISMTPPAYPVQAARDGFTGTVHMAVRVGRGGQVEDVVAEQVNLRKRSSTRVMRQARNLFEQAALDAARQWTFRVPSTGEQAALPYWTMRTTVDFELGIPLEPDDPRNYDRWRAYYAGPRTPVPWPIDAAEAGIPYALRPGDIHVAGTGLRLLTPLDGG